MKYQYYVFLIALILTGGLLHAQVIEGWQPLTLNINGTNDFSGVDAQYTLTTCDHNEIILMELTNHNNYPVKACWKNVVINSYNDKLPTKSVQDSVTIQPNSSIQGDCKGNNMQLVMKLVDFGILKEDFKAFMITDFDFVIIH
jgi:hypothetical protein